MYKDMKYKTPEALKGKYAGKSFLIIGSGSSTRDIIKYKDKLKEKFDVIIGINLATLEFEQQMDYHFIIEKNPAKMYKPMKDGLHIYRKDLPRILNWKAIRYFPKDIEIYKATRNRFDNGPKIRDYKVGDTEGLLMGPPDSKGLSAGSAAMCALHLASIMGAKDIYLVGTDLVFKGQYDHFYPDQHYRKSTTKLANRSPIVKVTHNGKERETTEFFQHSAKFFDTVIETLCKPAGITVYDFSDGLITKATPVNMDDFFGDSE